MAQTYTRQSTFADGDTITASLFNDEYNQLVNAFAYSSTDATSTGHRHDGTAGQGGNIPKIGDLDFLNKIEIDSTNNRWGFYVEVSSAAVEQIRIQDGAIVPVTDNDIDLGTSSLEFKDLYLDGTATIDTLTVDGAATVGTTLGVTGATTLSSTLGVTGATTLSSTLAVTGTSTLTGNVTTTNDLSVGGNLTVTGNATISGNLTFGDADTDSITLTADVASHITPDVDNTYDLGSSTKEWRDLYIDGTANIDSLVADTADINAGTIDNTVIGGTTAVAGSFTTATATTGNITNVNATTVDTTNIEVTNLKAKDGTSAGSIADTTGVVTLASSVLTTTDINGGTIDNTVIGGTTAAAGTFTTFTSTGIDDNATSTAITITSGNDVGVGVVSPRTNYRVDIQESTDNGVNIQAGNASSDIALAVGSASTADKFVIQAGGNVGIGTASPAEPLHVQEGSSGITSKAGTILLVDGSGNTKLSVASGTTSTGELLFGSSADNDAGRIIYDHSADGLQIWTDGSRAVDIDSSGNVGIGTTSPSELLHLKTEGTQLLVEDTSSGNKGSFFAANTATVISSDPDNSVASSVLQFQVDGSEHMRIDDSGNVGIGTTSPGAVLDVSGDVVTDTTLLNITGTAFTAGETIGLAFVKSGAELASIRGNNVDGTNGQLIFETGAAERMRIDSSGNVGIGTTSPDESLVVDGGVKIRGTNKLSFTNTSDQTYINAASSNVLAFGTNSTERMRIDSSGNVGIGTTAPVDLLHIKSTSADAEITLETSNTGGDARLRMKASSTGISSLQFQDENDSNVGFLNYDHSTNSMQFRTNDSEKMRLDSSGNVGIGTTSPSYSLDVSTNTNNAYVARFSQDHATGWGVLIDTDGTVNTDPALWVKNATDTIMWAGQGGNVGIGTTSPLAPLHTTVEAASVGETDPVARFERLTTGDNHYLDIAVDNANNLIGFQSTGTSDGGFTFGGAATERMRIDSSGYTGIGTTDPQMRLQVAENDSTQTTDVARFSNSQMSNSFNAGAKISIGDDTLASRQLELSLEGNGGSEFHAYVRTTEAGGALFLGNATNSQAAYLGSDGSFNVGHTSTPLSLISTTTVEGFGIDASETYVAISRSNNASALYLNKPGESTSTAGDFIQCRQNGTTIGEIQYDGADLAIVQVSDQRLKNNIADSASAGSIIDAMQVRSFDWNDGVHVDYGFVAQELNQAYEPATKVGGDDVDEEPWGIKTQKLIPLLVKEIQDLRARVAQLEGA